MLSIALLMSSACWGSYYGWIDVPTAFVRAEVVDVYGGSFTAAQIEQWQRDVNVAIDAWNTKLDTIDCPRVFILAKYVDAHPIVLVAQPLWLHLPQVARTVSDGFGTKGLIEVMDTPGHDDERRVLVHELGHAIGLRHNDDPTSIMHPGTSEVSVPSAEDMRAAAREMSCLP